jgi:hypothetical protein
MTSMRSLHAHTEADVPEVGQRARILLTPPHLRIPIEKVAKGRGAGAAKDTFSDEKRWQKAFRTVQGFGSI